MQKGKLPKNVKMPTYDVASSSLFIPVPCCRFLSKVRKGKAGWLTVALDKVAPPASAEWGDVEHKDLYDINIININNFQSNMFVKDAKRQAAKECKNANLRRCQ